MHFFSVTDRPHSLPSLAVHALISFSQTAMTSGKYNPISQAFFSLPLSFPSSWERTRERASGLEGGRGKKAFSFPNSWCCYFCCGRRKIFGKNKESPNGEGGEYVAPPGMGPFVLMPTYFDPPSTHRSSCCARTLSLSFSSFLLAAASFFVFFPLSLFLVNSSLSLLTFFLFLLASSHLDRKTKKWWRDQTSSSNN